MKKIINKISLKCRDMWEDGTSAQKIMAYPYILYLKLSGKRTYNSSFLVRCGNNAYYLVLWKCACSSINKEIERKIGKINRVELGNKNKIEKLRKNNFIFTFVRNPYNRVLSTYLDKIKGQSNRSSYMFNNVLKGISGSDLTFKEFVDIIIKVPDRLLDPHLKPCYKLIEENVGSVDFVGKLENMKEDWKFIRAVLNYKDIKKENSNKKGYNLKDYYTKEIAEKVYNKYKKDFEMFSYNKDEAKCEVKKKWN